MPNQATKVVKLELQRGGEAGFKMKTEVMDYFGIPEDTSCAKVMQYGRGKAYQIPTKLKDKNDNIRWRTVRFPHDIVILNKDETLFRSNAPSRRGNLVSI
ncbi:MAG: hypothetical protein WA865_10060 [Spirulinaceae cyanobacterium]